MISLLMKLIPNVLILSLTLISLIRNINKHRWFCVRNIVHVRKIKILRWILSKGLRRRIMDFCLMGRISHRRYRIVRFTKCSLRDMKILKDMGCHSSNSISAVDFVILFRPPYLLTKIEPHQFSRIYTPVNIQLSPITCVTNPNSTSCPC